MAMKKAKVTKKSSRHVNTRWLNNAMKSIGAATLDSFKEIAPNLFEAGSSAATVGSEAVSTVRNSRQTLNTISRSLSNNALIGVGKRAIDRSLSDLKSGNLYNSSRSSDDFGADDFDMDGWDFDDDGDDGSSVSFTYVNEDKGNGSEDASIMISDSIQRAAESSLRAQKASIDTMVSLASVSIAQNQRTLDELGGHLTNINNTLTALLEFHEENTKQFYESSIAAFEKIGGAVADDSSSYDDDDPLAIFNKDGGINFSAYKDRVKKNIKSAIEKTPGGIFLPFLEDPSMLEMLVSDPIGGLTKGVVGGLIPKVVQGTIEQVEETFTNFIPNMVAKMTSWADSMGATKLQRLIGSIFGLDISQTKNLNIDGEINKEAATFDRITRNSIVEVLPKYARESTEYLKQIAMHVTHKSADKLLDGAEIFDYETTSYKTAGNIRKELAESMKDAITSAFTDSDFGKILQSAGSKLNDKDKELYNNSLEQLFVQLSREKNLDVSSFNFDDQNSAIHTAMKGVNGKTKNERKIKKMLESSIRRMYSEEFGIDTAALSQMRAKIANTQKLKDYSKNYDMYQVLALGLNNDTDMEAFLDKQLGYSSSIKKREDAKKTADQRTVSIGGEQSLRHGSAKSLADEGINEFLEDKRREKEKKRNGLGQRVDAITGEFGNGFAQMGSHLSGSMWALMKGDSKGAVSEFSKIFTDTMKSMWEGTKEHFFEPLAKNIFGEKDENGYKQGGLFGSAQNKVKDTYRELLHKINGKPWVDSTGKEHGAEEDPNNSVVGKVTGIFKEIKEGVQYRLFGKKEDGEKDADKKVGIIGSFTQSISEGLKGWKELLFGKNEDGTEKDADQLKKQVMDAVPDALVGAGGGALVGIMAGGTGGSLLGTLIGGPIAGAAIGMGTSLLMRNEKFQNYLFGPEITNENGETERIGGLISAKTQKFFKDNKKTIVGGAALGALKGVFTGGGIMGTLLGGPIGGAAMGIGLSLLKESDMFKEFLYGNPEKGKQGVVNAFKGIFSGKKNSSGDEKEKGKTLKALGMGAIGAAGFGLTSAMVGKMGLLGAMVTPGGPIGAAVLGLTVGIASQSSRFKEFLFGKEVEDENGNKKKKGGLFGKMANYLHVEIFAPAKSKMLNILDDVKTTVKYDILDNIRLPFIAAADAVRERIGKFGSKVREGISEIAQKTLEKIVKPVGKAFMTLTKPVRAILSKTVDIVYNTSKAIITAPFKLMRHIASYTRTKIHKFGKTVRHWIFKGIKGFFGGALKIFGLPFKGVGKVLSGFTKGVGGISNFFTDHANLSKKGSLKEKMYRFGANITSDAWRTDHRTSRADAIEARRENKIEARKREQRDYNRAKMARMLGYDAKYFTKENAEEAIRVAKEKGKRLKFRGNLEDLYEKDPIEEAKKLMKKSTSDIAKEGDSSEDVNIRQLSEQYHTNEILRNIEKLCQGMKADGSTEEEVNEARREMIQEEIDSGFDALGGGEYVGTRKAKKNQKKFEKARRKDGSSFEDAISSFMGGIDDNRTKSFEDAIGNYVDNMEEDASGNQKSGIRTKLRDFFKRHGRARAKGGDAEEGKALLVGDGGSDPSAEELFIPKTDGSIISQKDGAINVRITNMEKEAYNDFVEAQIEASKEVSKEDGINKGTNDTKTFVEEAIKQSKVIEAKEKAKEEAKLKKAQLKQANDDIENRGTYASKKAAADAAAKEKEERSFRQKLLEMIGGLKEGEEKHQSLWSKLFNPKNGLLFLKLLAAGAILKKFWDTVKNGINSILDHIGWTEKNHARTNGESIGERIQDNVEDLGEVFDALKEGRITDAIKAFVLDEGEWDAGSGGRARLLARGTAKFRKPLIWLGGKAIKGTGSIIKGTVKGIGNTGKGLWRGAKEIGRGIKETPGNIKKAGRATKEGIINAAGKAKSAPGKFVNGVKTKAGGMKDRLMHLFGKGSANADDVLRNVPMEELVDVEDAYESFFRNQGGSNVAKAANAMADLDYGDLVEDWMENNSSVVKGSIDDIAEAGISHADDIASRGKKGILKNAAGKVKSGIKGVGAKAKGAVTNTKTAKRVASVVESTSKGPVGKVIKAFTGFLKTIAEGMSKKFPKVKPSNLLKSFKGLEKKVTDCLIKHFPKISAKLGLSTGGHAVAGALTAGLSEAGFIVAGAINGASGAARLFQTDEPDDMMKIISTVMGGALASGPGTWIDIISSLVADILGVDILSEIACMIYQAIAGDDNYIKLQEGRASFQDKYLKYQEDEIKKQYEERIGNGDIDSGVSFEQFKEGVANGEYEVEYQSFQDYNAEQHQTIGYKMGKGFSKGVDKAKKFVGDVGKNIQTGIKNFAESDFGEATFSALKDLPSQGLNYILGRSDSISFNNIPDDNPNKESFNLLGKVLQLTSAPIRMTVKGGKAIAKIVGGAAKFIGGFVSKLDGLGDYVLGKTDEWNFKDIPEDNPAAGIIGGIGNVVEFIAGIPRMFIKAGKGIASVVNFGFTFGGDIVRKFGDYVGGKTEKIEFLKDGEEEPTGFAKTMSGVLTTVGTPFRWIGSIGRGIWEWAEPVVGPLMKGAADIAGPIAKYMGGKSSFLDLGAKKEKGFMKPIKYIMQGIGTVILSPFVLIGKLINTVVDKVTGFVDDVKEKAKGVWEFFTGKSDDEDNKKSPSEEVVEDLDDTADDFMGNEHGDSGGGSGKGRKKLGGRGGTPDIENGFAYYSQEDPKWKNQSYVSRQANDGATMGDSGCGPTALAMVASQMNGKRPVSPTDMANLASASGYRDETGTNADFINYASSNLGMPSEQADAPSAGYLQSQVASGNPVILNGASSSDSGQPFTKSGHYLVAVGTDENGDILVNDPRGKSYSKKYSPDTLAKQTARSWSFPGGNGIGRLKRRIFGGRGLVEGTTVQAGDKMTNGAIGTSEQKLGPAIKESGPDWLSIVQTVKQLIAEQKPGYNQSGSVNITVNGKTLSVRTDCSGFVSACLRFYGAIPETTVYNSSMLTRDSLPIQGFTYMPFPGWEALQPGDILAVSGHTEISAGGHNVWNCGSDNSTNNPGTTISSKPSYNNIWRPANAGKGGVMAGGSAGGAAGAAGGSSGGSFGVSGTDGTGKSGGVMDFLGTIGKIGGAFASKAMTGILTGKWDFDFSDVIGNGSSGGSAAGGSYGSSGGSAGGGSSYGTGAVAAANVDPNEAAKALWDTALSKGITPAGAAGILGNFQKESGVKPNNLQNTGNSHYGMSDEEYTAAVDSGSVPFVDPDYTTGYGFAQWTSPNRKQGLLDLARSKGTSISDPVTQTEWLYTELEGGYQDVLNVLKTTDNVVEASNAMLHGFEQPNDQSAREENERAGYAQGFYDKLINSTPANPNSGQLGGATVALANSATSALSTAGFNKKGGAGRGVRGGRGSGLKVNRFNYPTPLYSGKKLGGFGEPDLSAISASAQASENFSGISVQKDPDYRVYDQGKTTTIYSNNASFDTTQLEALLTKAIEVLTSIEGNTAQIEGLSVGNVNTGGNVVVNDNSSASSVTNTTPSSTTSRNSTLASQIAQGR